MPQVQLIAIDLDGTLLNNDLQISDRAQRAIRAAGENGVKVTLCTGRMYASARLYALELGLDLPLITYNGALVKTSGSGDVLYHRTVPVELARQVVQLGRKYRCQINVYHQDRLYVENISDRAKLYASRTNVRLYHVHDLIEFLEHSPTKVLAINKEEVLADMEAEFRSMWGNQLYITKSSPDFLEFLNPEATKGRGLEAVARALGVPREKIMAIGDSYNDLEMFKAAGYAVAMGNARKEIQDAADYVTCSNDDDGVAEAIENLVLSDCREI